MVRCPVRRMTNWRLEDAFWDHKKVQKVGCCLIQVLDDVSELCWTLPVSRSRAAGIGILVVVLGIALLIGCWYCRRRSGYRTLTVSPDGSAPSSELLGVSVNVCACVCTCPGVGVETEDKLLELVLSFQPCGGLGSNSACQSGWQTFFPAGLGLCQLPLSLSH